MKSISFVSIIFFAFTNSFSQSKNYNSNSSKWTNSIVNLEIYYSKKPTKKLQQKIDSLSLYNDSTLYLMPEHDKLIEEMTDSLRIYKTGTAIYFKYENKRFLITARHIIFDQNVDNYNKSISNFYDDTPFGNSISNMILRIPLSTDKPIKFDKQLAGLSHTKNYILSDSIEDLAIISLNLKKEFIEFADFLEERGVKALSLNDIDTSENIHYGQDILCAGYPSFGFQKFRDMDPILSHSESTWVFDPAITYGKVSMPAFQKYFFVGDINVMPGNSGGALISNDKLVGIVSKQPSYPIENNNGETYLNAYSRYPYAICIKASFLLPLLRDLIKQEENQ